ncbi:MAG TPA: septum formation inhibitor Maf [Thiotrichales bacterium]|nr:septum formation inhibitor Maf [Thiotrichales bacterium]
MSDPRIILGSSSPFRRELLARLGLPFESVSPDIDESMLPGESPEAHVRRLSREKALAIAVDAPALVIGSDQVAVCEGEVLGKPGSHERAREQLRRLSGRCVLFHTGLCLRDTRTGELQEDSVATEVRFRGLSDEEIERYLRREQPYGCAGSFKSEGLGISLFESVRSDDPTALIGLPLIRLCEFLRRCGIAIP